MGIFKRNHSKDNLLKKFIKKQVRSDNLVLIDIPYVEEICGPSDILRSDNILSIYCKKSSELEMNKLLKSRCSTFTKNKTIAVQGESKVIIITDISDYASIPKILEEIFSSNNRIKNNIDRINDGIEVISSKINYKDIMNKYPTTINNLTLRIKVDILSDKYVLKDKLYIIPDNKQIRYTEIKIRLTPMGQVISVKLDNPHPNADEHLYYCIGDMKFQYLSCGLIDKIISKIPLYNLNDCYWRPDYVDANTQP